MFRLKLVPEKTSLRFMERRKIAFVLSVLLILGSIVMYFGEGLNRGIDFEGGILVEVKTEGPADLAAMRSLMSGLGLGQVALQEFGAPDDVLIRVERQPGGAEAQQTAVNTVKSALDPEFPGISYRRVEFVGPTVSGELVEAATIAVLTSVVIMLIYIWLRFEWQFSLGAIIALVHDVIITLGMFAVTRLEFNLAIIAAILTIVGYSMNDTVVVYDRVRENLRKFKQKPLAELLDVSINDTLTRTIMTSGTTMLALMALVIFGGEVLRGFTLAMIWGIVIGTYSSIFVASPFLLATGVKRDWSKAVPVGA